MSRVGFFILLSAFSLSCAGPVYERPWIEVETTNFQILSTFDERETIEIAQKLELFRTVVQSITNAPAVDSVIPTRIIIFDGKYDFNLFMKGQWVAGYFREGMRTNYMVMRKTRKLDPGAVMRHEYVHYLMNNATDLLYPFWYSEGFAEFLSTVTVHEDGQHVIIGAFPTDRKMGFRRGISAPYADIISSRPGSTIRGNMSYEQSWALVHWIQLGRGPDQSPGKEMDRYLELVEGGHSDVEAFEEAFGVTMIDLRRELIAYLNGNYQAVAVPLAFFHNKDVSPSVRTMTQAEVSVALGQLALVHNNGDLAQNLFTAACSANPTNARAHAGLGDALALRELWKEAEPHFLRALEIDPESAENELDYAEYLHHKALASDDEAEKKTLLREARKHYVRSYKLDSGIPETYAMFGMSYLTSGENPSRSVKMLEHAHSFLPANPRILKLLAKAYVMTDREDEARPLIERIVANSHEDDRAAKVDEILAEIGEEEDE